MKKAITAVLGLKSFEKQGNTINGIAIQAKSPQRSEYGIWNAIKNRKLTLIKYFKSWS